MRFILVIILLVLPIKLFADYGFICKKNHNNGWYQAEFVTDDNLSLIGVLFGNYSKGSWKKGIEVNPLFVIKKTDHIYKFKNLNKKSTWKTFTVSRRGEFIRPEYPNFNFSSLKQCNTLDSSRIKEALSKIKIKINSLNKEVEDKIKARQKEIDSNKF